MAEISKFPIDIFSILGMRNLSSFVGEVFAAAMHAESEDKLAKNPHQDGYPDLLLMDSIGQEVFDSLAANRRDKAPFSPFRTGGIEVKATVGSTPPPSVLARRGLHKPDIGDQRIDLLSGYDWKAHHRETNNLLAVLWDFVDGLPTVVAVFYASNLDDTDWGQIVQPSANGGRTTSVSIMTRAGVKKMYEGWICVIDDERYKNFLNRKNNGSLIPVAAPEVNDVSE